MNRLQNVQALDLETAPVGMGYDRHFKLKLTEADKNDLIEYLKGI